ncbi:MAG: cbb3-type cytochrome oxidase assembly protein CcoS [Parachlamydiales bacterium]|jgi:nitrogen fixation-related uncharacterized protein
MLWFLGTSLAMAGIGIIVYCYFHSKGQFDDNEDVKYILFRDEENERKG